MGPGYFDDIEETNFNDLLAFSNKNNGHMCLIYVVPQKKHYHEAN